MNKNELKELMQARRKDRNQESKLPKNAILTEGMIKCLDCASICINSIEFSKHLNSEKHKEGVLSSKRQANTDIQSLENETLRNQTKQKLTPAIIERINKEVEDEFQNVIQQEPQLQKDIDIPNDFFDKIEVETQIQKQLQQQAELSQKQEKETETTNNPIENLKLQMQNKKQNKISKKYDFIDVCQNIEEQDEFHLEWKAKQC